VKVGVRAMMVKVVDEVAGARKCNQSVVVPVDHGVTVTVHTSVPDAGKVVGAVYVSEEVVAEVPGPAAKESEDPPVTAMVPDAHATVIANPPVSMTVPDAAVITSVLVAGVARPATRIEVPTTAVNCNGVPIVNVKVPEVRTVNVPTIPVATFAINVGVVYSVAPVAAFQVQVTRTDALLAGVGMVKMMLPVTADVPVCG
jgi:hypothetical protein